MHSKYKNLFKDCKILLTKEADQFIWLSSCLLGIFRQLKIEKFVVILYHAKKRRISVNIKWQQRDLFWHSFRKFRYNTSMAYSTFKIQYSFIIIDYAIAFENTPMSLLATRKAFIYLFFPSFHTNNSLLLHIFCPICIKHTSPFFFSLGCVCFVSVAI